MSRFLGVSLLALMTAGSAKAADIGDVFYIALENHNFTQPVGANSPQQVYGNPAAPYINSLITPGNPNAAMVSYASNYENVPGVHPSEPNYVWAESGTHGPLNDSQPYPNNIVNAPSLSAQLAANGMTWRSYQEDADLLNTSGNNINGDHGAGTQLTNTVAATNQYEVPLTNFSGTSSTYTNAYNGSHQYNYAAKHNPMAFFTATNGGNDSTPGNTQAQNYAPLQQLATDLANNTVANYNWITPDQYNDMHTALNTDFTYNGVTYQAGTDAEQIALGDNFLSQIIPMIEASDAFKNNGMIVIWNDETEGEGPVDTSGYTSTEIVISPLAKGDAYTNDVLYSHSSDLKTLQEIFGVAAPGGGYLGAAGDANDLSDLFQPGTIPSAVPEPSVWAMMAIGFAGLAGVGAMRRRASAKAARRGRVSVLREYQGRAACSRGPLSCLARETPIRLQRPDHHDLAEALPRQEAEEGAVGVGYAEGGGIRILKPLEGGFDRRLRADAFDARAHHVARRLFPAMFSKRRENILAGDKADRLFECVDDRELVLGGCEKRVHRLPEIGVDRDRSEARLHGLGRRQAFERFVRRAHLRFSPRGDVDENRDEDQQRVAEQPEEAQRESERLTDLGRRRCGLPVPEPHRQQRMEHTPAIHRKSRDQVEHRQKDVRRREPRRKRQVRIVDLGQVVAMERTDDNEKPDPDDEIDGRASERDRELLHRILGHARHAGHPADRQERHFRRLDAIATRNENMAEFVEHHAGEQQDQKEDAARRRFRAALTPRAEGNPHQKQEEGDMDLDRGSAKAADGEGPGHRSISRQRASLDYR